jgi:hypothetical protein
MADKGDMKRMARRSMLEELRKEMRGLEGEGLSKVTVAAKDPEDLKEGLEKAEEIVEDSEEMPEMAPEMASELMDDEESEEKDYDSMSREELLACVKEMM